MQELFLIRANQKINNDIDKLELLKNTPIYKLFNYFYDIESASYSRNYYSYFNVNLSIKEPFSEVRHNFKNPSIIISSYFDPLEQCLFMKN